MNRFNIILSLILIIAGTTLVQSADSKPASSAKTFNVSKGGTLEIAIDAGDVCVTTWDKNEVSIMTDAPDEDDYGNLRISQQGNTVRLTAHDSWNDDIRFDISVPVQFNLNVRTSFGNISVRGRLIGNIEGETSAGDITLGEVDGTASIHTSGGDVRTGKLNGKASLNTSGGEIEVASSTSELELQTSGGDIKVGNVAKSLHARTAGGDIVVGDVGGEATVSTDGGNIKVGKVTGQASLNTAGGDIELHGGNGSIRASTSGGNIYLTNLSGSVEAKTSGGDIQAELSPGGKGKSKLVSSYGQIKLSIPETAKVTLTARIRIQGRWRSAKNEFAIRSDFKEESSQRDDGEREIRSTYLLNGGGETITIETVNSDIEIRKLKK